MKRYIIDAPVVLGFGTALLLAGCATPHYQVKDPQSGNTYFTERVENLSGGSVKLKDARSGSTVTLQNSEVTEISNEAFKAGVTAPAAPPTPAAPPAPAVTPAPAATPPPSGTSAPTPTPAPSSKP